MLPGTGAVAVVSSASGAKPIELDRQRRPMLVGRADMAVD